MENSEGSSTLNRNKRANALKRSTFSRNSKISQEYCEIIAYGSPEYSYAEVIYERVYEVPYGEYELPDESAFETENIDVSSFHDYVKSSMQKGDLEKQFNSIIEVGNALGNKSEKETGYLEVTNFFTYIDSFKVENAYAVTKAPVNSTIPYFWELIWNNNIQNIISLGDKGEFTARYWPEEKKELISGKITIRSRIVKIFADFEINIFDIKHKAETRELQQFRFTSWPNHGVPLYTQSLVPFVLKFLKIPLTSSSPVLLLSSGGVGRVGTVVLVDICLRMAARKKALNVVDNLKKLRLRKSGFVDNADQYKLVHLVIGNCLKGFHTAIPCDKNMEKAVRALINSCDLRLEIDYLEDIDWQYLDNRHDGTVENYSKKNRFQHIIPGSTGRIFLSLVPDGDPSSSYINAVRVDGFRCPDQFIVTQQPMPNTIAEFWRMIVEKESKIIVSLNEIDVQDKTSCRFWPTQHNPQMNPTKFISVTFEENIDSDYCEVFIVKIHVEKEQKISSTIQIFALKDWQPRSHLPPNPDNFLRFLDKVANNSVNSFNTIVTCFDGATASGIYVALSFVIEKIKLEKECDVCLAVRSVRQNRRLFIKDENQYVFLYESAVLYVKKFQYYTNLHHDEMIV